MTMLFAFAIPALAESPEEGVEAAEGLGGSMLQTLDWAVIGIFFLFVVGIGVAASKTAGKNTSEFFLGGRGMPWWLLGVSMVACTFSCDTPNLVTDFVRTEGVAKNWAWWAFLITGMVTVFVYAQLWRRSKVMTDLEFYEIRYSGKPAAIIRGFRSLYLGIFFNCLIMGTVTLAAIKIGQVIFDLDPLPSVIFASIGVVIYATAGGIKGCIWADFFQYSIALFGAIWAAFVAVQQPEVGGMSGLLSSELLVGKLNFMPDFSTWLAWVPLLLIPILVQWWAVWYPGAEPGGGGYIAQRMLAAKDEKNAVGATLFFNFMHYAVRPWPWIIVGLASMLCYPTLAEIKAAFPGIDPTYLKHDIAYPVMISRLSPGILGLVVASLIAAYMSTIGTHLNWGSSYAVNDFYKRFVRRNASEKEYVLVGRICTVALMVLAAFFALTFLQNAGQAFSILLLSGGGTGAIYLLRWFWWRINAWTEIVAMIVATIVAFWIVLGVGDLGTMKWFINNGSIKDRVERIEDAAAANAIKDRQQEASSTVAAMQTEVDALVEKWRDVRDVSIAKRDASRAAYEKAQNELNAFKESITTATLADEMDQKPWQSKVNAFRERFPEADALVKGDRIFFFDPKIKGLVFPVQLLVTVILVTIAWLLTSYIAPATDTRTLRDFYKLCHPGGPGWKKVVEDARKDGEEIDQKNAISDWKLPIQLLSVFLGCVAIYSSLFAVGNFLYGNTVWGILTATVAIISTVLLFKEFNKIGAESTK